MRLRDRLRDRQPQPGAADGRGRRGTEEPLEEPLDLVRRDADARVRHLEHGMVPLPIQPHRHGSSFRRELDRVGEKIADHLGQAPRIGEERQPLGGGAEPHLNALTVGGGAGRLDLGRDERDQVDLLALDGHPPGVEARDGEDVVHEAVQPCRVAADDLEEAHLHLGQLAGLAVEHELEVADDRRERRPQLVGDRADELVLQAVELLQLLVLRREGPGGLALRVEQLLALEREREFGGDAVEEVAQAGELGRVDVGDEICDDHSANRDRRTEGVAVVLGLARRDDAGRASAGEGLDGALGMGRQGLAAARGEELARVAAEDRLATGRASRLCCEVGEAHDHQSGE